MRNPAGEIGLARRDDKMVAAVGDTGRKDDIANIHLVLERPRQLGMRLEQGFILARNHARRIVRIEKRPIGAIDTDDLLRLDSMP